MNIIRSNIRLAIDGGTPVIDRPLTPYNTIGSDESEAIESVMSEGCLSGFIGAWGDGFSGGEKVEEFEKMWQDRFGIKNAIFLNSNTSGLIAALGAIGLTPGDEVIVPPTTMSATVMAPLVYGGIPVFADIEENTFCINPQSVVEKITSKTRAIIAVNLFGHPAELKKLRTLADSRGIYLIENMVSFPGVLGISVFSALTDISISKLAKVVSARQMMMILRYELRQSVTMVKTLLKEQISQIQQI